MKVYVAKRGERHERSEILGVFYAEEKAVECCLTEKPCFEGGWTRVDRNEWTNGCDYVLVEEHEVKT